MNSAFAVLCVCLLAAQAQAQAGPQISLGSCPEDVKVVANFDVHSYMGHWFEIESYWQFLERELHGRCTTTDYSLTKDGKYIIVENDMFDNDGFEAIQTGYAVPASNNGDAKLEVTLTYPIIGKRTTNYMVVDTDYKNYSVVYSCTNILFGIFKYESAQILGRERTLSDEHRNKVDQVIANSNFLRRDDFYPTKQTC